MKRVRKNLKAGQDYRSDDGHVDGVILRVWPIENASEALIRLRSTGDVVRVSIPGDAKPERR